MYGVVVIVSVAIRLRQSLRRLTFARIDQLFAAYRNNRSAGLVATLPSGRLEQRVPSNNGAAIATVGPHIQHGGHDGEYRVASDKQNGEKD